MKIVITESQLKYVLEQQQDEEICVQAELDDLNNLLTGIVQVDFNDLGGEMSDEEVISSVTDPKQKNMLSKVLQNLSQMSLEGLRDELKKVISLKNLKEQQTPYLDRTTDIAGVKVPTAVVHGSLGLIAISILSKMLKGLGNMDVNTRNKRRRKYSRVASRAQGCQGGAGRAKLQRMKRRRENWRSFLRKIGLR
jgi:hypothetical protein